MSKIILRPKHYLLSILTFALMSFIFWVNRSWGNPLDRSLLLSVYGFLWIFMGFSVYWEIRDYWQFRWYQVNHPQMQISSFNIPLGETTGKFLKADQIRSQDSEKDCPIIIFTHGFSDDRVYTRHFTIPMALNGFEVISYDCRGTQGSRKAGHKSQFVDIVKDLDQVIQFVSTKPENSHRPIHLVGFSLGAFATVFQGLRNDRIDKIIAIASIADYRKSLPASPIPFKGKWWLWWRYKFFGVPFNLPIDENKYLSPVISIQEKRDAFLRDNKDWDAFIRNKLYLLHAINDKIIPLTNFVDNVNHADLPTTNWMVTKRGGHNFLKYELVIISSIIHFLQKNTQIGSEI